MQGVALVRRFIQRPVINIYVFRLEQKQQQRQSSIANDNDIMMNRRRDPVDFHWSPIHSSVSRGRMNVFGHLWIDKKERWMEMERIKK